MKGSSDGRLEHWSEAALGTRLWEQRSREAAGCAGWNV